MIKLRLLQTGKRHQRQFRIVALEARSKRETEYLDNIGWYNPRRKEVEINKEKALKWLTNGAQPTETVKNLFVKEGIIKS